jgi:hypothetical protein
VPSDITSSRYRLSVMMKINFIRSRLINVKEGLRVLQYVCKEYYDNARELIFVGASEEEKIQFSDK